MTETLSIIRNEHRSLATVLHCLKSLIRELENDPKKPNFKVFHGILTYLDSFLHYYHHPKENIYLFPAVCRRHNEAHHVVHQLEREHDRGDELLNEMRKALSVYEFSGAAAFDDFRDTTNAYVEFERDHAIKEERELLPLAEKYLSEEDWVEIDAAFSNNEDPLFGEQPRKEYRQLLRRITNMVPAPYGLGPEWESEKETVS